eukprot:XP_001693383.1 predicted protein [Chlamydomonas reinhardtii]
MDSGEVVGAHAAALRARQLREAFQQAKAAATGVIGTAPASRLLQPDVSAATAFWQRQLSAASAAPVAAQQPWASAYVGSSAPQGQGPASGLVAPQAPFSHVWAPAAPHAAPAPPAGPASHDAASSKSGRSGSTSASAALHPRRPGLLMFFTAGPGGPPDATREQQLPAGLPADAWLPQDPFYGAAVEAAAGLNLGGGYGGPGNDPQLQAEGRLAGGGVVADVWGAAGAGFGQGQQARARRASDAASISTTTSFAAGNADRPRLPGAGGKENQGPPGYDHDPHMDTAGDRDSVTASSSSSAAGLGRRRRHSTGPGESSTATAALYSFGDTRHRPGQGVEAASAMLRALVTATGRRPLDPVYAPAPDPAADAKLPVFVDAAALPPGYRPPAQQHRRRRWGRPHVYLLRRDVDVYLPDVNPTRPRPALRVDDTLLRRRVPAASFAAAPYKPPARSPSPQKRSSQATGSHAADGDAAGGGNTWRSSRSRSRSAVRAGAERPGTAAGGGATARGRGRGEEWGEAPEARRGDTLLQTKAEPLRAGPAVGFGRAPRFAPGPGADGDAAKQRRARSTSRRRRTGEEGEAERGVQSDGAGVAGGAAGSSDIAAARAAAGSEAAAAAMSVDGDDDGIDGSDGEYEVPREPMAPLEGLAAAVDAVRPRVRVATFAHRSVAEQMRTELQARRERQLLKARQLQAQLRCQPAPLESAAAGAGAAGEVAAGAGVPVAPPAPPIPNYALVEKRAPAVGFSPARTSTASLQPAPRYSREPGPGHYEPSLADAAMSRHTRAATPVFGSTRRPVVPFLPGVDSGPESPTRAAASAAADPSATVSDEDGVPLERWAGPDNPWDMDLPTRRRRPAWGFPAVGHMPLSAPAGRELLDLRPVYDLVSRRLVGVPDFTRTPDRYAGEEERLRRLRRQPTALDYEADAAWAYLCRHVPGDPRLLAAARHLAPGTYDVELAWRAVQPRPHVPDFTRFTGHGLLVGAKACVHDEEEEFVEADGGELPYGARLVLQVGLDEPLRPRLRNVVLEGNRLVLSPHTALDYVRPRPHVALIPPLVPHAEREPDPAFHAVYDVDPGLDLVLRRPPGHPGFDGAAGRDPPLPVPYGIDPRPAAYGGHRGRWEAGPHPDWDLTAWLDYNPSLDAVRRRLVAQAAVPLGLQLGREQAARADPRVGEAATGDLDAGCYRVRHRLVMRSAPAIDFGRGADPRHTGLQPGAVPADPDAGNVLLLQPRQPEGWQPPAHEGRPWRQPFGRGEGRWERPFADPAYRFLAAAGDEGGALLLRHSADDLAALRARATAANAPAAAWGWMTSRRDAQVLQPDPANSELELIKNNPPNDARVVAIRRRDRVLARMVAQIKAQRAAVADV